MYGASKNKRKLEKEEERGRGVCRSYIVITCMMLGLFYTLHFSRIECNSNNG